MRELDDERSRDKGFAWFWVSVFIAAIAYGLLRALLSGHRLETNDLLVVITIVVGIATFVLVGYQVVLAFQQTEILKRQDAILARREVLDAELTDNEGRRPHLEYWAVPVAENEWTDVDMPLMVTNSGLRTSQDSYITLFLAPPDGSSRGAFIDEKKYVDAGWSKARVGRQIGTALYDRYDFHVSTPIFPRRSAIVRVPITLMPFSEAVEIFWQISGENGVYPLGKEFGKIAVRVWDTKG